MVTEYFRLVNLYGPVYGNRMLHTAGLKAIEEHENKSIREHLTLVCNERNADGLDNWRGYYRRHLQPFDLQIQEQIRSNADCIRTEDMDVFRKFVQHIALHQYRMENWREGKC